MPVDNKTLNITNGDYFNQYFIEKFGGAAIPFCECIMDGEVTLDILSDEFINLRTKALNVSKEEYLSKMQVPGALSSNKYSRLCLWFGRDTFCQMNLLTLLAYLEQIKCCSKITLCYIDDATFDIIENDIDVKLGIYKQIYKYILISRQIPNDLGVLNPRAIDLYFDYHSDNSTLSALVKANTEKSKTELISILLEASEEYGLSDMQAQRIIDSTLSYR